MLFRSPGFPKLENPSNFSSRWPDCQNDLAALSFILIQTQQFKLFPLIASAYAFLFSGAELREIYFRTNSEIQQGNVDMLPEVSQWRHSA